MPEVRALIAAAGTGSRAGLPYPKTLHPVLGKPILIRLLDTLKPVDPEPTVIVSPAGRDQVVRCLAEHGAAASLIEQPAPTGMGDAVLCFRNAPAFADADHVLLVWGDIPLLEPGTVETMVRTHLAHGNDFTFATRMVDRAYTIVGRDAEGRVTALVETREAGIEPRPGERDIGLFVFCRDRVFDLLARKLPGAEGRATGEHGFLYLVRHLAERGFRVEALPVATERDLISLNRLSDLDSLPADQAHHGRR
jgi:bifunctional N-acetylglucosamine-1-phosphate-uridyltransferase/glucosamine-1-phosphate-acetyltransferase GlmU-like protein